MTRSQSAAMWLVLATAAWGLSFPTAKAVMEAQGVLMPGRPEWFHAAFILLNRMVIATVVMLLVLRGRRKGFTWLEVRQGLELGLFGGLGMLLQTDAQNYIAASTSAFFTQFTCVFVPLYVAVRSRRVPSAKIIVACALVVTGCAVLSGVRLGEIGFGRGEWETILSAVLFTGQIVCLERAAFAPNDPERTATVMFAVKAAVMLPFVLAGGVAGAGAALSSGPVVVMTLILALFCTVFSYATMTRWQPRVTSTHAGLIYASEPIFATLWALFLPGVFSALAGISYANEHLSRQFFIGGALILTANVLLLFRRHQPPHGDPAPMA